MLRQLPTRRGWVRPPDIGLQAAAVGATMGRLD